MNGATTGDQTDKDDRCRFCGAAAMDCVQSFGGPVVLIPRTPLSSHEMDRIRTQVRHARGQDSSIPPIVVVNYGFDVVATDDFERRLRLVEEYIRRQETMEMEASEFE
ncbi:MAG: hypothetical protein KDA89_24425 [Planctomycetaceae bacterium]|nr:hypothetical protein [Planctomycetaceae bacterium]MCA9280379.1 hypothetical protein [Phycisphaerales bacterium]